MLTIIIPGREDDEYFNEATNQFVLVEGYPPFVLQLEHSLVSLSKWESIWKKPFLADGEKSLEETIAYISIMTITPDVPPEVYKRLTEDNLNEINAYLGDSMTATWFREDKKESSKEIITAELIYYRMIALQIPWESQHWHLNRLFTLIRVCNEKNAPAEKTKLSPAEIAAKRRALNKQRQAMYKTTG